MDSERAQLAWGEIAKLAQGLASESCDDIQAESFHATPRDLFTEMFQAVLLRSRLDAAAEDWRRNVLTQAARQRHEGDAELESEDEPCADATCSADPNPDGFVPRCRRRPKGHTVATAHAEAVLLDRTRIALDEHYDAVFREEWLARQAERQRGSEAADEDGDERDLSSAPRRRGAYKIDRKVMEARLSHRYGTFSLPGAFTSAFRHPRDETDWTKLEIMRSSTAPREFSRSRSQSRRSCSRCKPPRARGRFPSSSAA